MLATDSDRASKLAISRRLHNVLLLLASEAVWISLKEVPHLLKGKVIAFLMQRLSWVRNWREQVKTLGVRNFSFSPMVGTTQGALPRGAKALAVWHEQEGPGGWL